MYLLNINSAIAISAIAVLSALFTPVPTEASAVEHIRLRGALSRTASGSYAVAHTFEAAPNTRFELRLATRVPQTAAWYIGVGKLGEDPFIEDFAIRSGPHELAGTLPSAGTFVLMFVAESPGTYEADLIIETGSAARNGSRYVRYEYQDPTGDIKTGPDITLVSAARNKDSLTIAVRFAPRSFDPQTANAIIGVDSDGNAATGFSSRPSYWPRGADYELRLSLESARLMSASGGTSVNLGRPEFLGDGYSIQVALASLGINRDSVALYTFGADAGLSDAAPGGQQYGAGVSSALIPSAEYWRTRINEPAATGLAVLPRPTASPEFAGGDSATDRVARYRAAVQANPQNARLQSLLAGALQTAGMPEDAIDAYRTAINIDKEAARDYWSLGLILMQQRRWAEAETILTDGIHRFSNSLDDDKRRNGISMSVLLARVLHETDRNEAAEESLRQLIATLPDHESANTVLAQFLEKRGKLAEAERVLRSLIRLQPKSAFAHQHLAAFLERRGKWEEAGKVIQTSISLATTDFMKDLLRRDAERIGRREPSMFCIDWGEPTGRNYWRRVSTSEWIETYPDGREARMVRVGTGGPHGLSGEVVTPLPKRDIEIFIPAGGPKDWLWSRLPGGEWTRSTLPIAACASE